MEVIEVELSEDATIEKVKGFVEDMDLDFLGLEESMFDG